MSRELTRVRRELQQLQSVSDLLLNHISKLREYEAILLEESNGYRRTVSNEWVLRSEVESRVRIYMDLHMRQYGNEGRTKLIEAAKISTPTLQNILQESPQGEKQRLVRLDTAYRLFDAMNMQHAIHEIDVLTGRPGHVQIPEPPPTQFFEE